MKIKRIINIPINSNCYIISQDENCILIDPGSEDDSIIENSINGKTIDYIFLTHEHFDHIWCTDRIRKKYNAKLCCSIETAKAIINRKKNMSIFYDQVGFELNPCDLVLTDEQVVDWRRTPIEIIYTPGHTNGCICIKIYQNLFTGDTIIKGIPTITKLPGGNKYKQQDSIKKLMRLGLTNLDLYCGHWENDIKSK